MQNRAKNTLIEYNGSLMIILYDFLQESSVMPRSKNDSNLKKKVPFSQSLKNSNGIMVAKSTSLNLNLPKERQRKRTWDDTPPR